ncbi:AraC-type DNA-binding protein [Zobellia uliginosa]|uniref:AraC-type DNA-binding protein n=1 Tax=Zobellia uliginosa TaxID=143224 RepID=A0ABY1L098_9FLAO|nr:AraC family transcriptional regulator [Zobellia uliginosa]SIS85952.1 AraC-type DNA-binding protein [Zobellia uliginosa]
MTTSACPKRTIQKLYAESVLKKNLQNPPTILELSVITGINQFKLKQNFKWVFGKPIFTYVTELRMEEAKKLTRDEGCTISETAYRVGYKNPQHFTAAFKRKYNYLPSRLKTSGV